MQFFFPFLCVYLTLYIFVIYHSLHGYSKVMRSCFSLWLYYFYFILLLLTLFVIVLFLFHFVNVDVSLYQCISIYTVKKKKKECHEATLSKLALFSDNTRFNMVYRPSSAVPLNQLPPFTSQTMLVHFAFKFLYFNWRAATDSSAVHKV